MHTIENRLATIERELCRAQTRSRWLVILLLVTVGCAVAGLTAQPGEKAKEIRASAFIVEDEKGIARIDLRVAPSGPLLRICDEDQNMRLWLALIKGGHPSLAMFDENGKLQAHISSGKGPALDLCDENGKSRLKLGVDKGAPMIRLYDPNENVRLGLSGATSGPSLGMFGENQKIRIGLHLMKEGPAVDLFDEKGEVRAHFGTYLTESTAGAKTIYPESTIMLFGPGAKALWKAP